MGMVVSQSGRVVAGPSGRASPSESAHPQEHDHGRDPKLERNVENGREPEAESDDRQTDQQQRSEVPQPPESPDEHGAKRALLAARDRGDRGNVVRLERVAEAQNQTQGHVGNRGRNHAREDTIAARNCLASSSCRITGRSLYWPTVTAPDTPSSRTAPSGARPDAAPWLPAEPEAFSGESETIPGRSPWDCLRSSRGEAAGRPVFLWEAPEGEAIAGIGALYRIECSITSPVSAGGDGDLGRDRFQEIRLRVKRALDAASHRGRTPPGFPGAVAIGGFSFAEQGPQLGWPGFPDASFFVPAVVFWKGVSGETIETRWTPGHVGEGIPSPARGEPALAPSWDRATWIEAVRLTLDRIRDGGCSKAVLARSVEVRMDRRIDAIGIMESLRTAYPTCYRFLIADGNGNAFLGASPERLVRLVDGEISSEAGGGSQRCEPGDDEPALARSLTANAKDRSEHAIVLRHLLETLRPLCDSLHAPEKPEVMRLLHLLHLRTPVRGRARDGAHILDLVSRLHPTPAIAGWPRREALAWIDHVEPCGRGWYAGPMGWVNGTGEGDFAVGIRSLALCGERARIFAGAGIVEGSDPELEWNETELKMKGILDAVARD